MIMNEDLLFYDLEVFEYDALAVFMNIEGKEVAHFWNNRDRKKYEDPSGFEGVKEVIQGKTLVGYNNYSYDDNMLSVMMNQAGSMPDTLYANNKSIIDGLGFHGKKDESIFSLDTMQQIDVNHPSLKQIEGNMGISIVESSVDFNIGRPLTDEERREVLEYCRHDVRATIEVYKLRKKSYFESKNGLLQMIEDPEERKKACRWNTTTLSAKILLGNGGLLEWKTHRVPAKYWRNIEGIPEEVWDMWETAMSPENILNKGKSKTINAFGCKVVFGMGGLHGAPSKPLRCGRVKHKDVASMYPSSICRLEALGPATEKYNAMRQERIKIKKSDPVRASALKLILNSVYGNFKSRYSSLYNPLASATVCIYGQIALFSLCRELHKAGYRIINANTDGVVYIDDPDLDDRDEMITDWWEHEFEGFKLETDYFAKWIQRDVNNYIAVEDNGKITVKGGDVNKFAENKYFANNSARIIQIAMVEKLVNNIDPFDTFQKYIDQPMLWQYILKAGSTYKGVQNAAGEWQNKVNRVFAAAEGVPFTKLYKIRQDDGQVNFPDVPERMFLWNEDVKDLANFRDIVDQSYYHRLVTEKLKAWEGG